jgi:hypothetical protein
MDNLQDYETIEYHLIYTELISAARHRGTVTYQELAHVVGLPRSGSYMGKRLGGILGAISENEVNHQRPMLSAVAVKVDGKPGEGFYTLARGLGLLDSDHPHDEAAFWEDQMRQCYHMWQQSFAKE